MRRPAPGRRTTSRLVTVPGGALGIYSVEERQRHLETGSYEPIGVAALKATLDHPEAVEQETVVEDAEDLVHETVMVEEKGVHTTAEPPREDQRHRRRQPALLQMRHQDAAGR